MNTNERFDLIKRNTQEIVSESELMNLLNEKKVPSAYIGLATTGRVHIGYFIPFMKVKDFIKAGFKFKVLLADLHAHLDDRKTPFELLDLRVEYYKKVITALLESIGADVNKVEFVKGTDFQLQKEYTLDMYRMAAINTLEKCRKAASEVVRFGETPKLSGFLYPILQALDEQYLDVDVQFGGIDQRKILMFARENHPKLGYKPRIAVMTPILPGLTGSKMSSSDKKSKIDLIDSAEEVKKKISSAFCPEKELNENGVMAFMQNVLMVLIEDKGKKFVVERPEKFGGNVSYSNYSELEKDFLEGKLHPMDLKNAVARELNLLLEPIRKKMQSEEKLLKQAFPEE
ncbi:MAG: tyrosine--tRNA ligase [Candidatus Diapherotrites archaeon]|nr:tyrosine--tRNA ligase [Candidatus Diapherotrites archaeon]